MSAASTSAAGALRTALTGASAGVSRGVRRTREKPLTKGVLSIVPPLHDSANTVTSVYLNAVPRTATATDVLQALRDMKLVSNTFSVHNITPPTASLPRSHQHSLNRGWHVNLPSNADAKAVHRALRYDRSGRDAASSGLFPGFFIPSYIQPAQYTTDTAKQFRERQREHLNDQLTHDYERRMNAVGDQRGAMRNDTWPLDESLASDGRDVLLVGMPAGAKAPDVQRVLSFRLFGDYTKDSKELGLDQQSGYGISKLPASLYNTVSWFVLRFDTAAYAHRAVRKLHMTKYSPPKRLPHSAPPNYLLRAEIVN